jgi:tetratricopeptide (TPR) repeat protein
MTTSAVVEPQGLVEKARRLVGLGQLSEAEAAFHLLTDDDLWAAEGFYGLGVVQKKRGDLEGAESQFASAIERRPTHANALYQMGYIAESRKDFEGARGWYELALEVNPQHAAAAKAMSKLPMLEQAPVGQRRTLEVESAAREPAGIFDVLLPDSSESSKRARALLHELHIPAAHPPWTAYLSRFLSWVALVVAILALPSLVVPFLGLTRQQIRDFTAFWSSIEMFALVIVALVLALNYVRVKSIVISLEDGRLQIEEGLLGRQIRSIELWRVNRIDFKQSMLNRITGDGTLVFVVYGEAKPFTVTGLARGAPLVELRDRLRELILLLRTNRAMQGIVT